MLAGFVFFSYICKRNTHYILITKQNNYNYEEKVHLRRLWIYL